MTKGEAQALDELHLTPEQRSARMAQMDEVARALKGIVPASTVSSPEPPPATRTRKRRSDAGKQRESFYVSVPGARFDMASDAGRVIFDTWLGGALTAEGGDQLVLTVVTELLREIDRLRGK